MTGEILYFGYATRRPEQSNVTVYASTETHLLGATATVAVIGDSHFVDSPAANFYEISSCVPPGVDQTEKLHLDRDLDRTFSFETDRLVCETVVTGAPLDDYPADRAFDLSYTFEPDAHTAVVVDDDGDGYETYHTYPEYDLTVRSRTNLSRRG